MFQSILDDVKQQFQTGNMITRIIMVNVVIYVLVNLVNLGFTIKSGMSPQGEFDNFIRYFFLHQDLLFDFKHPWVFFTYMFMHLGFWHILWNMLLLYWFGRIVGDFIGDNRILPIYILAGLAGAILYLMTAPFVYGGGNSTLHGASGSVMGIIAAAGMIAPNYIIRLLFVGPVKLKYIVLILFALDLFAIAGMSNVGGHFCHIGGALFGFMYVQMLRQGTDLAKPVNNLFNWMKGLVSDDPAVQVRKQKKERKVFVRYKSEKGQSAPKEPHPKDHEEKLDDILDKIKASGYENLTDEEKEFLFRASKK